MSSQVTITAYAGDAKTLLAFDLPKAATKDLAGFTIFCKPGSAKGYYLWNTLRFKDPAKHAQDAKEPPASSVNAPFHKFRWVHVPGIFHQGLKPVFANYTYTVTPRYFDSTGSMLPLDKSLSGTTTIAVGPFKKKGLELAFTRGFVQSQGFVHRFSKNAPLRPKGKALLYDINAVAGKNAKGESFTFADEYAWMGFTTREKILGLLEQVVSKKSMRLDVFAYDLSETTIMTQLLKLAGEGRVRVILDNASLHHDTAKPKPEDEFEKEFNKVAKGNAALLRGKFGRYAHDKVFVLYDGATPVSALAGSTNFSVTGLYVNSNHVLVFNDARVAAVYASVFQAAWSGKVSKAKFLASSLTGQVINLTTANIPTANVTFSPHDPTFATKRLGDLVARVHSEGTQKNGSVMFAVMDLAQGSGAVFPALKALHKTGDIFSYGISDSPDGIQLYEPGRKTGLLVTGKPIGTKLPPPFDQVPALGFGHQIHHKFVVCGFNRKDATVYCSSSNLAQGGEEENGDNLIEIQDQDVATAFAIEAVALVDHFQFLDRSSTGKKGTPQADKAAAAVLAGWFLSTTDKWTKPYYDPNDLHCSDRLLF